MQVEVSAEMVRPPPGKHALGRRQQLEVGHGPEELEARRARNQTPISSRLGA
jgi:hypothetical protein